MAGILIASLLVASLLLVHLSLKWQPLPPAKPLDVDSGLPLPEVGQASTVFALTALFGAYLGIYLFLGLPALAGLATGTVCALLLIQRWMRSRKSDSFEGYIDQALGVEPRNGYTFALSLSATQCGFAVSELVILRHFVVASFALREEQADLLVLALMVIAYFYVAFGGYMAVFRTDVLQFGFIATMVLVALVTGASRGHTESFRFQLHPRTGYWPLPWTSGGLILHGYHFLVAAVMGMAFLLASPDTWKRVFLVGVREGVRPWRFVTFVLVGAAPFAILVPLAGAIRPIADGPIDTDSLWAGFAMRGTLFVGSTLGLVACFLSAFSGALVVCVHMGLLARRKYGSVPTELPRFHWRMVSALVIIFLAFTILKSLGNPYLLGCFLIGPYAILAGVNLGCNGNVGAVKEGAVFWVIFIGLVIWMWYFFPRATVAYASTYQANAVPWGVLFAVVMALTCKILTTWSARYARPT